MDDLIVKPERRHIKEPNLVPVIDMFTVVIFFLILSTSFFSFTKITIPPSKVSVNTDPLAPPPLGAKLLLRKKLNQVNILLQWTGSSPGQEVETASLDKVFEVTGKLAKKYKSIQPKERTIQLGMSPDTPYQTLIDAMDGIRESLPDMVLISPDEALARTASLGATEGGS